jgi:hypothetical protein
MKKAEDGNNYIVRTIEVLNEIIEKNWQTYHRTTIFYVADITG